MPGNLTPNLARVLMLNRDGVTELTGVLKDAADQPAPEFVVVAFSVDRKY